MTTIEAQRNTGAGTFRSIQSPPESSLSSTESQRVPTTSPSASMISSTTTVTGTQHLPPKAPLSTLPTIPHQEPASSSSSRPTSPTPSNHSLSDTDSESSFPSVSSSFFFSSAAHSPNSNPYSQPHSNDSGGEYEGQEGLHMIIPSLTLPETVHPTPRQEQVREDTEIRLIAIVGPDMLKEVEQSLVRAYWEEGEDKEHLKVLKGTVNGRDSDPELDSDKRKLRVALWVIEHSEALDSREISQIIRRLINSSFRSLDSQLHQEHEVDSLASSTFFSDVHTAVLICPTSSLTDHMSDLEYLIPSIHLDLPISQQTLHDLILPTGLSRQKKQVADNFLRWRASNHERDTTLPHLQGNKHRARRWNKADWEREVEEELGVSLYPISSPPPPPPAPLTARVPPHTVHRFTPETAASHYPSSPEATILSPRPRPSKSSSGSGSNVRPHKRPLSPPPLLSSPSPSPSQAVPPHHSVIADPLHLPSLVMLGVELFGAMRARVFGRRVHKELELRRENGNGGGGSGAASPVKFLMLGFCVGVGVGVWLGRVVWGTV
ncbi:hypothetical protein E1B28_005630 [Marasmius oreades]|uniref:Uncharacterized protein n=1 Tax=Marasmius oreades TaxID=181124 RepID=A0A9P7UUF8_9AGAR|nr:uncharacterized protein E1B28_005630 [Marasmius oreades]KAG7094817.1 hypothetical protein E1B28_005630 [Marasmius oreades]